MITVAILINGNPIIARSCSREGNINFEEQGNNYYKCDDGRVIEHNYADGAVRLAIKMLEGVKE